MKFRISDDLVLGADAVVSTAGIFATKGMGKSHLAQVLAEEMLAHEQVVVAIDPTDAWYGLRSSADGKRAGYPVVVIGGDHGDLKLESGGAVELAGAVVAERFSCVICTAGMSDTAETKFVREFLDTVYRCNREPIHIFVDEADIFAPQRPFDVEDSRCIRAMSHVVRRGRKNGIGTTLITQRPAELNASVRTMVDMLFVLGMSHNLDIEAIEKWLRLRKKKHGNNAAYQLQEEMIASLDSLRRGDAWAWAPRLGIHTRFRARPKRTFDSGATPMPGAKVKGPKKLAPVDLLRLGRVMAAAVQRQKDNDPSELKKQVALLRLELARLGKGQDRVEENEKANHSENVELRSRIADLEARLAGISKGIASHLEGLRIEAGKFCSVGRRPPPRDKGQTVVDPVSLAAEDSWSKGDPLHHAYLGQAQAAIDGRHGKAQGLKPAQLRLLSAIAWWESLGVAAPDLVGVAFVAGTSSTSSAFDNNRSRLRAGGYIDYPSRGSAQLTPAGRAVAPVPLLPRTSAAVQAAVIQKLAPALGRMLRALIVVYPGELSLEDLAAKAMTSATSSAFDNNRSWLRARGLAEYPRTGYMRAAAILFPQVGRAN